MLTYADVCCGNVYPYTVTDDRVKRKDNGEEFFPRDCIWKFSYHEIFCSFMSEEIPK
jgi:hypothetical protein